MAGVLAVDRGPWRFRPRDNVGLGAVEPVDVILSNATFHSILDHDALFSAILQGMILVRVEFASIRARLELLSEGDMISPWHGMDPQPTAPRLITTRVISNLEIALLARRFTLRTARWTEINSAVMQRLLPRSRCCMQSAINSIPGSRSG